MIPERKTPTPDYPWIPPDAIRWLDQTLGPTWTVLETGMGGSTIYFAERVATLISYENNPSYFDRTMRLVKSRGLTNVDGRFRRDYPRVGLGNIVDTEMARPLDMAFIDGRGRVRSVIDVVEKIRPGGWLVLDDSQRGQYDEAMRIGDAHSTERIDFNEGDDRTTAWRIRRLPGTQGEEESLP